MITEEQFIERHVAFCTTKNTRKRSSGGKGNHGGGKRACARRLWRLVFQRGLNPDSIVRCADLAAQPAKDGRGE